MIRNKMLFFSHLSHIFLDKYNTKHISLILPKTDIMLTFTETWAFQWKK